MTASVIEMDSSLCSIFLDRMVLSFLFERMAGVVIQKDDLLDFSNNFFFGDIEPDLFHFGTQRNIMFLSPHGVIFTIMNG